jgi:SAM-dependent methyltransferase
MKLRRDRHPPAASSERQAPNGTSSSNDPVHRWLAAAAGGRCNICGAVGTIEVPPDVSGLEDTATLRESLLCRSCRSIARDRALILGLSGLLDERGPLAQWAPRKTLRVLETSGYRGHPRFLGELFDYFNLPYVAPPTKESLTPIDARAGGDLQDLHFPDGFIDVVITAEVLEHVPDEQLAIREIARVLAPGGHLVLEVPYSHEFERTEVKVHRWRGRDVYLYPPEYHAEDTLVYRIYGRDLLADLAAAGLAVAHVEFEVAELGITRQPVILATKGPFVNMRAFRITTWLEAAPD